MNKIIKIKIKIRHLFSLIIHFSFRLSICPLATNEKKDSYKKQGILNHNAKQKFVCPGPILLCVEIDQNKGNHQLTSTIRHNKKKGSPRKKNSQKDVCFCFFFEPIFTTKPPQPFKMYISDQAESQTGRASQKLRPGVSLGKLSVSLGKLSARLLRHVPALIEGRYKPNKQHHIFSSS